MSQLISLFGIFVLLAIAWSLSDNRWKMPWRTILCGLLLQWLFALFVLKTSAGKAFFWMCNKTFVKLLSFSKDGARFVFGSYVDKEFSMALNVLPTIIFFSTLMAIFYHLGVMQRIVQGFAWVLRRTMRTSGAETLSVAANILVGQTEAPLVVRPYIASMTSSELMAVMVAGMAHVAGGVLAAYVGMLQSHIPGIAGHLISASVMNAPASLVIAKIMVPEVGKPLTGDGVDLGKHEQTDANVLDAAARGVSDGLRLALNVGAMLLAFVALVALANFLVGLVVEGWSIQRLLSLIFWPIAWIMGTPAQDCATVATLLGEKTVLNEFVAYGHLTEYLNQSSIGPRAAMIASYALCGFANFGSIGIQIAGIGTLAPDRRSDLAKFGLRAMVGGSLASFMTACVASVLS